MIAAAAAAFAATNVDDVIVVAVLVAAGTALGAVALGQVLGVALLASVSAVAGAVVPDWGVLVLGGLTIALGVRGLLVREDEDVEPRRLGVAGVAGITVANGADNIAVWVPLYAQQPDAAVTAVFALGTVLLVAGGVLVGRRPAVQRLVERAGDRVVPLVLIAVGVVVVLEAL